MEEQTWSYRNIAGMLLYLDLYKSSSGHRLRCQPSRRFCHNPKKRNASVVKTLVRYLNRTPCGMGMIVKPTGSLYIDCYVDADFAGLHGRDPDLSPTFAKSRTGNIITLGGCPLLWKSHLQSENSFSNLEPNTLLSAPPCVRSCPPRKRLRRQTPTHLHVDD